MIERPRKRLRGEERLKKVAEEREARLDKTLARLTQVAEESKARKERVDSLGIKEGSSVTVNTPEGLEEGVVDSFDKTWRIWVRFKDLARAHGNHKQTNLCDPFDIELKS